MPSPFPGMDPFIEGQKWADFHHELLSAIREQLVPQLRPKYIADVQKAKYVESPKQELPLENYVPYLVIRTQTDDELVTTIEVLLPVNKRQGSDSHKKYLAKRNNVYKTQRHLVEIDLLRGGARLPMGEPFPAGDYYAIVSRGDRQPTAEVYVWMLPERLPRILVPLLPGDTDAILDLQAAFAVAYDRAGYDYKLHRRAPVDPPLSTDAATWVQSVLNGR